MKTELKAAHIAQGLAAAESGDQKDLRIRDTQVPGLCVRVRGHTATWTLMTRTQSIKLADLEDLSLRAARDRAREVLRATTPPVKRAVAALRDVGIGEVDANLLARGLPIDPTDKFIDAWTWETAMDKFLEVKIAELTPKWFKQYKSYAKDGEFFPVEFRALPTIDYPVLDLVRQNLRSVYKPTRVLRMMEAAVEMLDWVWQNHRTEGGLHKTPYPWWRDLREKPTKSKERFIPSLAKIVITIDLLKQVDDLKASHVKILDFTIQTAQRIDQVCSLKSSQVEKNEDGSAIVHWTKAQMKGKQPHALWIPKAAVALINFDTTYAFPADASGMRSIQPSVINRWMGNLWGRERKAKRKPAYKGKPGPPPGTGAIKPVLKDANIPYWTPHAIRTTLSSVLIDNSMDAAASAILAHKKRGAGPIPAKPDENQAEEVTLRHYNRAQRLPLKMEGVLAWHKAMEATRVRLAGKEMQQAAE